MSLRRSVGFLFTRRFSPRASPSCLSPRSIYRRISPSLMALVVLLVWPRLRLLVLERWHCSISGKTQQRTSKVDSSSMSKQSRLLVSNMSGTTTSYLFSCAAAPPMKEEDLKARFEDWTKKYSKTYRDEEEKAMRFQVFKETIERIESLPPDLRDMLRPLNCFADTRFEEFHGQSCIVEIDDPETREYNKKLDEWLARKDKGERFIWPPVQQGNKQATQVSA